MANIASQSVLDVHSSVPASTKAQNATDDRPVTLRIHGARYTALNIITPPLGVATSGPNLGKPVERWIVHSVMRNGKAAPVPGITFKPEKGAILVTAPAYVFTSRGIEVDPAPKKASKLVKKASKKSVVETHDENGGTNDNPMPGGIA